MKTPRPFNLLVEMLRDMSDDELRELRSLIDDRLRTALTDPAPPPALIPQNLGEN